MGKALIEELDHWGIDHRFVAVEGEPRTNLKIMEQETGRVTDVNEPGFQVQDQHMKSLLETYEAALAEVEVVVLAGSLPPGVPSDFYGTLILRAKQRRTHVFLDADGVPLKEGIKRFPHVIKPNLAELEQVLGRRLPEEDDRIKAGVDLCREGIGLVTLSLGEEGAWFFAGGTWDPGDSPCYIRRQSRRSRGYDGGRPGDGKGAGLVPGGDGPFFPSPRAPLPHQKRGLSLAPGKRRNPCPSASNCPVVDRSEKTKEGRFMKKLVAVTGCPTGIAHTFMAAESLKQAAEEKGIPIKVETRGATGVENRLRRKKRSGRPTR